MSKEINELITEMGQLFEGYAFTEEELDKLKSLYEQLKLETAEEFEYPFEYNESYWLVDSKGEIVRSWWYQDSIDTTRCEMGNAFFTEEEAQKELEKRILLIRFRQFRDKCNGAWKPDFKNDSSWKIYIGFNHNENKMKVCSYLILEEFNLFGYFKNESDAERAIELFGDEIKRLFVEVA